MYMCMYVCVLVISLNMQPTLNELITTKLNCNERPGKSNRNRIAKRTRLNPPSLCFE